MRYVCLRRSRTDPVFEENQNARESCLDGALRQNGVCFMEQMEEKGLEISLLDFVRVLKKQFVKILIVALVAAIAIVPISIFTFAYGTTMTFHLSPADGSDDLLFYLSSESFAETLLLEENGLPPVEECNAADYAAAVEAIRVFEEKRKAKADIAEEIERRPSEFAKIQEEYDRLVTAYNNVYNLLSIYLDTYSDTFAGSPEYKAMIQSLEAELAEAKTAKENYEKDVYYPEIDVQTDLDVKLSRASVDLKYARIDAEEAIEKVVAPWRAEHREEISRIASSVTFEYSSLDEDKEEIKEEDKKYNYTYIKVQINAGNDEEYSQSIADALAERFSSYVEKHVEKKTGTTRVECKLLTTVNTVKLIGTSSPLVKIATNAAITFVVAAVAMYAVFFVIEIAKMSMAEQKETKEKEVKVKKD